jgi:hypothetical protein
VILKLSKVAWGIEISSFEIEWVKPPPGAAEEII